VDQSVGPFEHKILTADAKWMRKPAGMSARQRERRKRIKSNGNQRCRIKRRL